MYSVEKSELLSRDMEFLDETKIPPRDAVELFYSSSWKKAVLHHSISGGKWTDITFQDVYIFFIKIKINLKKKVPKRYNWKVAKVDLKGNVSTNGHCMLEFVITNTEGIWDKHVSGQE